MGGHFIEEWPPTSGVWLVYAMQPRARDERPQQWRRGGGGFPSGLQPRGNRTRTDGQKADTTTKTTTKKKKTRQKTMQMTIYMTVHMTVQM